MIFKKKTLVIAMAVLSAALVTAGCGKTNIGYVDYTRVQQEAPQIKASMEEMQAKMTDFQKEAETQLQEAAKKQSSPEDMAKLQQQLRAKGAAIQQQYVTQLKAKTDAALDGIVKEKKLDVVVHKSVQGGTNVTGGIDVTEDVIQKLQ